MVNFLQNNTRKHKKIFKLDMIILHTSNERLKGHALHTKETLLILPDDMSVSETARRRLFEWVNNL